MREYKQFKNTSKMKTVILKSLTLINFKGCHNLTIDFNESVTNIFGANGSGKSREQDGFTWLLFGKNAEDKKDFDIKNTKDKSFNQQDHEVKVILKVDNETISLRRIYKEKWTKKKGSETAEFTGHETEYFYNDVPVNQTEYNSKISAIIEETVFKLITNPLAFNSMKWQDQRAILVKICPSKSNEEIAGESDDYKELVSKLTQGKTEQDYIKQLNASIKLEKENLKAIPTRIDESLKGKAETLDFVSLKKEKELKESQLIKIENDLSNKANAFDEILKVENEKKLKLSEVKNQLETIKQSIENESKKSILKDDSELKKISNEIELKKGELLSSENVLKSFESKEYNLKVFYDGNNDLINAYRNEWIKENESEFIEVKNDCVCGHCGALPEHQTINDNDIKLKVFNEEKAVKLDALKNKANLLKTENENVEIEIKTILDRKEKGISFVAALKTELFILENKLKSEQEKFNLIVDGPILDLDKLLLENLEYQQLLKDHSEIEKTIKENPSIDNSELNQQKQILVSEIEEIKSKLQNESINLKVDMRIVELKSEQKQLAQKIASVEKELFVVEKFNKLKVQQLEDSVNSRFKYVKFKLFETQVNGGESEVCEVLVDGVPYSSANTCGKLNAGLDIISVLIDFYQVNSVIWLDNRESCTEIIDVKSQIINLIVSPNDKFLRVE